MSEHLLFLQAAGSDFDQAHGLVGAVAEAIRAPQDEPAPGGGRPRGSDESNGVSHRHRRAHPGRIAERVERAGFTVPESLIVALAAHASTASPLGEADVAWIASAATRIGNTDLLREIAGVVFAFNTINRIASARRVQLEYRFLREFKPIRGWVERRLASVTGLAYDLSFKHPARQSPAELLERLGVLLERLGAKAVPDVFGWLSQSPVVLEGVVEMLETNVTNAGVRFDLLKEAAAIAVASRAMPRSGLLRVVDPWLPPGSLPDSGKHCTWSTRPGAASDSSLVSECRRYSWQVANAAHTITDEQLGKMSALGLAEAELLDLTLASALFAALAIIEPIGAAVAPPTGRPAIEAAAARDGRVQSEPTEDLAV